MILALFALAAILAAIVIAAQCAHNRDKKQKQCPDEIAVWADKAIKPKAAIPPPPPDKAAIGHRRFRALLDGYIAENIHCDKTIVGQISDKDAYIVAVNLAKRTLNLYKWHIITVDDSPTMKLMKSFPFSSITDVALQTRECAVGGITTVTKNDNGIGRAVVGGMLGGSVGAVVGAATAGTSTTTYDTRSMQTIIDGVIIYTADIANPKTEISCGGNDDFNNDLYNTIQAIITQNMQNPSKS